jgi:hypothetical protein
MTEPRVHAELFNRLKWDWLKHGVTQKIMDTIWHCYSERRFSVDAILKQWQSDPVISGWVEKAAEVTFGNAYEMALNDILKRLEEDAIQSRLRILQSEIEQKKGSAEVLALLKEFDGLTERRKSL